MVNEWRVAARLVAFLTLGLGFVLILAGGGRLLQLRMQSQRGLETMATIDSASLDQLGTGGSLDLSWHDEQGAIRQAFGVEVTSDLGHKLHIGNMLSRSQLRIRYRPDGARASVLVVEDVPTKIRLACGLALAGFLAITGGSALMLALSATRARSVDPDA